LYPVSFHCGPGINSASDWNAADAWGWRTSTHLWTDCLENVRSSTSHNPMDLHGLLQGILILFLLFLDTLSMREDTSY
jgi:hypothetical protein